MSEIATLICILDTTLIPKIDCVQQQVTDVQAKVDGIQIKVDRIQQGASSSGSLGSTSGAGAHTDRPSRFQKMDFLKFDGKTDPLIFVNRCETLLH
jgi:hypothetical protein